jgi:hypothetical protein
MSSQGVEVEIESVTGKQWDPTRRQSLVESMNKPMGHDLDARAELKDRNNLGERIDGQPEDLFGAAEPGEEFVQLQMWELEVAERVFVQRLRVQASTRQPGGECGLTVAEDALGS